MFDEFGRNQDRQIEMAIIGRVPGLLHVLHLNTTILIHVFALVDGDQSVLLPLAMSPICDKYNLA